VAIAPVDSQGGRNEQPVAAIFMSVETGSGAYGCAKFHIMDEVEGPSLGQDRLCLVRRRVARSIRSRNHSLLRTDLAKRLGHHVPIDIVSGTSVGAINAAFLASTMSDPDSQALQITSAWKSLRIEELIGLRPRDVLRGMKMMFGGDRHHRRRAASGTAPLDTSGLERFVIRTIPWRGIDRSLPNPQPPRDLGFVYARRNGAHGRVLVERGAGTARVEPRSFRAPSRRADRTAPRPGIGRDPDHVSCVKIGDEFFTDGGLRQNTPMSPAIRLGADRLLLISLKHVKSEPKIIEQARVDAYPKPLFMVGKALNALLLDHTEYDLMRMQRINMILEAGHASFGDKFESIMNHELVRLRARRCAAFRLCIFVRRRISVRSRRSSSPQAG